jgi:hypothetical protein
MAGTLRELLDVATVAHPGWDILNLASSNFRDPKVFSTILNQRDFGLAKLVAAVSNKL